MKYLGKKFRRIFLITTLIVAVLSCYLNINSAKDYYSQFTSKERIQKYFDNNEVIPNGTKMLGAGGDTVIFLTTPGAGTWTVPEDWNDTANTIEVIGGGGNSNLGYGNQSGGGGGGAYSKKNNLSLTPGASISYQVGAAATDTWFKSITDVLAKCGSTVNAYTGGGGGQASSGYGDVKYSGGNGGNTAAGTDAGGGGGGAAGPNGNGNNGLNTSTNFGGDGGQGDLTFGGLGGLGGNNVQPNTVGGNGEEWTTHGSGGGGGGGSKLWPDVSGRNGGLYGGGAGGKAYGSGIGGYGAQGIIVITYTPVVSGNFNLFFF